MLRRFAALLLVAVLVTPVAQAGIVGVNNGGVHLAAAPADVRDDAAISYDAAGNYAQNGFDERQGVLLGAAVGVDGGFVPAGMTVDSHMIFLNTLGTAQASHTGVRWDFDGAIVGVMSDANGTLEAATSALLGAPGTIYPAAFNARGLEGADGYVVNWNQLTVDMTVTEPGDWIRVLTADRVVPEPGTLVLLGVGGLAAAAARRRKQAK